MSLGVLVFVFAILAFLIFRVFLFHEWPIRSKASGPVEESQKSVAEERKPSEARELPRRIRVGGYFPVPERGQPAALLLGISGPLQGQQFPVEKEIVHIGASPDNDLPIAGDDYLSRNHACLRYESGILFIFDKGSRNGTFVNEKRISATGVVLNLGDRIHVGISTFQLTRTQIGEVASPPRSIVLPQHTQEGAIQPKGTLDEHNQRNQMIRLVTAISISVVVLIAALFVILHDSQPDESKKWAFGAVGTIVGYWLKA